MMARWSAALDPHTVSESIVVSIMYTIGEFAALGRVSVRMLRHYDQVGLLTPAMVDARNGYRRYAIEQLPQLLRIVELRDLGVGLEQIAEIGQATDPNAALHDALATHRRALLDAVASERARIARIERRLRQLEGTTVSNITYKSIDAVTVYAAHAPSPGMGPENVYPVIGPLIARLDEALLAADRPLIEPGIFWYTPNDDETVTVTASYIAEDPPVTGDGYDVVTLPQVPIAATLEHVGDMTHIGESWTALLGQLVADGYRVTGPCREVYLNAEGHEPQRDWVTELQAPVERAD